MKKTKKVTLWAMAPGGSFSREFTNVIETNQEGFFYYVYLPNGMVKKYPMKQIIEITEEMVNPVVVKSVHPQKK